MKVIMKTVLLSLTVLMFMSSCNKDTPDLYPNWYPDSYMIGFEGIENLDVSASHVKHVDLENKILEIGVYGREENATTVSIIGYVTDLTTEKTDFLAKDGTDQAAAYKEKTASLNDISFKGFDRMLSRNYVFMSNGKCPVLKESVMEVSVTCNKAVGTIPAGGKLDDVLMIFYEDQFAVVSNGYKNYVGTDAFHIPGDISFPYALRGCKLSEFNSSEHPYISNTFLIYAEDLIIANEDYTFTISVKTKEGSSLEKNVTLKAL